MPAQVHLLRPLSCHRCATRAARDRQLREQLRRGVAVGLLGTCLIVGAFFAGLVSR